ncbi:MAG: sigma-70 family RNA polymerase sigma factor [Chthoniobacteraceae bacterium]
MELDDAELIRRTLTGADLRAFDELVRRHQSPVRCLLRRLARGNEALADDLAQETFVIAWRQLGSFRQEARFATWLHQIAYRAFLGDWRRRREHEPLEEDAGRGRVESTARSSDFHHDLELAMLKLSQPERAAVTLCLGSGLTHEEAAVVLEMPVGTVKTHLLRGRRKAAHLTCRMAAMNTPDPLDSMLENALGDASQKLTGLAGVEFRARVAEQIAREQERAKVWRLLPWAMGLLATMAFWCLAPHQLPSTVPSIDAPLASETLIAWWLHLFSTPAGALCFSLGLGLVALITTRLVNRDAAIFRL